jgi:hypothetical protein
MRASLKQAAIVLAATFVLATVLATPASAHWWQDRSGPVYDGPAGGPYYTGPYKGVFARKAYPDESRCLMERRVRDPSPVWTWHSGPPWNTGTYTVRVCR